MRQRVALAKRLAVPYYLITVLSLLTSCRTGFRSIAPVGLTPTDAATIRGWLASYAPKTWTRYDLKWKYRNARGAAGGRAAIRVAPPGSLRVGFRGPFGKSGTA